MRRRQFAPGIDGHLEPRVLLSHVSPQVRQYNKALTLIDREIAAYYGGTTGGSVLPTLVQQDLASEYLIPLLKSHHGGHHHSSLPSNGGEWVSSFQSEYNGSYNAYASTWQPLLGANRADDIAIADLATFLADDSALANMIYGATAALYHAAETGAGFSPKSVAAVFEGDLNDMNYYLQGDLNSPIYTTGPAPSLLVDGQILATDQLATGQSANLGSYAPVEYVPPPITTSPPPPSPPFLSVSPRELDYTFTYSPTLNPPAQFFTVYNEGGGGSVTVTAKASQWWIQPYAAGPGTGGGAAYGVNLATTGLKPGTYSGTIDVTAPGATDNPVVVYITLNLQQPVLSGSLQGYVKNVTSPTESDTDSFQDPYTGPMSATVTPNVDSLGVIESYTVNFLTGSWTNVDSWSEDFSASVADQSITIPISQLASYSFYVPMGDGDMVFNAALAVDSSGYGGAFYGTWYFQRVDQSDLSDSGNGNFSISS
jgi:hypothetical protein